MWIQLVVIVQLYAKYLLMWNLSICKKCVRLFSHVSACRTITTLQACHSPLQRSFLMTFSLNVLLFMTEV